MNQQLKQRLVGATILVALIVIFVPMLFEDSREEELIEQNIPEIPQQLPESKVIPLEVDAPEPGLEEELAPFNEPVPQADATEDSPALTAWAIQVGSFARRENAAELEDRLRKAGFPAFVESIPGEQGNLFRVRVGPELEKARAERMRKQIEERLDIKCLIVPYPG